MVANLETDEGCTDCCGCEVAGLRRALRLCEEIDSAGQADGLLREPVDCVEAIRAALESAGCRS